MVGASLTGVMARAIVAGVLVAPFASVAKKVKLSAPAKFAAGV